MPQASPLSAPRGYTRAAKWFHWIIAVLVLMNLFFGYAMDGQTDDALSQSLAGHTTGGILVIGFVLVALLWRMDHNPPAHPASMSKGQRVASWIVHHLVYCLLLIVPITGLFAAAAHDLPIMSFWAFDLRDVVSFIGVDNLESRITVHWLAASALAVLVIFHISAALVHELYYRDNTLRRMTGWMRAQ